MELPLGGPSLRHYTQSRPRPHRQKLNHRPSRPQEPIIESENETVEHMGRVDEGVEEFFTKRVLPAESLKNEDETSRLIVEESIHASAASCPPPTKTLRRKLGDFFTLRKRRGLKTETSQEGRSKKASIADLIRPLREAARADKDKHKVKESDKDNDKENDTERQKEKGDGAATGDRAVEETPPGPGSVPLRRDAAPPRRALREGKSQSLILLSGSAAPGTGSARHTAKKTFDGQHSFEQKLSLMLQRIGVTKSQPAEEQNPEGEMKKADSEGTIIDNKPEPPPTFSKPWTMSTSSETRPQIRQSASAHESAGKPALPPKPIMKPGPQQPTASGPSTPENELAKIQEAETSAPGEACPPDPSASSPPPCPVLSTPSPPAAPSISTSAPHSDTVPTSPPAPAGPPSDAAVHPEPVELEAEFPTEASPPVPVDGGAAVAAVAATQSSAANGPSSSAETPLPGPVSGAAAVVPAASPLSPTAVTIPTTSSETLSPLPASSTSLESITSTPLSPPATTTSTTTPSVTSSVSASISESSASAMPPSTLTHSPLPVPNGAITNCTASASVSPVTSSDTTAVDTASVVSAEVFQNTPSSPTTHSAHTTAHPDLIPTTDIFTSSEAPASSVVTPAQVLVDASSFCKTTDPTDPIPSTVSTASSHAATPATASVTSPVSTDGTNSVPPSPSTQPGPPIPSDTTNTSCPMSSTSGSTDATHPSITSTTTSISTVHSETPSSVNLPVTNNQGATHLSSISTSEATEAPSVTVPTAASPDSTSPTYNSQAEIINVRTPPEEKPRHDSTIKEKVADDDNDSDVQRSERNERNGNSREGRSSELPDAEGEKARRSSEREDCRSPDDGAVGDEPGPGPAQGQKEERQNGTETHPEAAPRQDETNSVHEK